jgi:hypothetical protein
MSTLQADGLRFSRLRRAFLAVMAMAAVAAMALHAGGAAAQKAPPQAPPAPKQVQLTAKQVEQYIAAFKELSPLFEKLEKSGDKPDPKLIAQVNATAKKIGFRDLDEYDQVAMSIVAVLDGVDPKTKQYSDPIAAIKKDIAAVQADKKMNAAERKKMLEALNSELAEVQPVQHPANIPLVIKYYDRLAGPPQQ